jgi:lycopene elongase/hydratase (dihydrobisanhydrobacterioruberin-forming)
MQRGSLQVAWPAAHRQTAALVAVSRPWFWPVSWVPAYVGMALAEGAWWPARGDLGRAVLDLVVLGPLIWTAILAENDLHDVATDRANPRKATAPLVSGAMTPARLAAWRWVFALAALAVGLVLGPLFALGVAGVLALGWAYSAPPLRLKDRAGADVAVNAFVVGVVAPAGGWSLSRSPAEFPWLFGLLGFLFAAAFYIPTTVTDLPADLSAGDTTFAVRLGARLAHRLGVALWTAALVVSLICARAGVVVPQSTWAGQLGLMPLLIFVYWRLTRSPTIFKLACLSFMFGVPTAGFLIGSIGWR